MTTEFTIAHDSLTIKCRLFQRRGGFGGGSWVLSGYVNNEERLSCDVTATVRRYHGDRLIRELTSTAQQRLIRISQGRGQ